MFSHSKVFASADSTTGRDRPGLLSLPEELHSELLTLLDPADVLSYARTCRTLRDYSDNQHVW